MHKKGIIIGSAVGVTALFGLILTSGGVFATQTCETDATTGLLVCTDSTTGAKTYQRSASATASVTVASSCSFSVTRGTGYDDEKGYTATLANGATVPVPGSTFKTSCNDPGGYAIYAIGYSNNTFGNTDLIFNDTPDSSNNIQTDGSGSHWGMSLSATTTDHPSIESGFDAPGSPHVIPSTYTKIASYGSSTAGLNTETEEAELLEQAVTVTYSATASNTQPAGTYTGAVKYTMVHPSTAVAPDIDSMQYLQDLADLSSAEKTALLANMVTGEQHQLADSRDGKLYYVAKLADGNIWMTQNLDLDIIAGSTALTSENTDLSTDQSVYTANNTIYALKGENDTYGYTYENGIATWMPERSTIAYNQLNDTTWINDNYSPYSYDYLDANGGPVYPDDNVSQATAGDHGLSGNYYNWTASLASNDSTYATGNPANSICPKGWRLPNVTNKEFGNLLVQYNIISTNTSNSYIENVSSVNSMGASPLYFVRGGYVDGGSLDNSGSYGDYWSSTRLRSSNAYNLYYNSSNVNPQDYYGRYYGWSVRCLARSE